jgi:tetratricopeptide (TPR) repeat protein
MKNYIHASVQCRSFSIFPNNIRNNAQKDDQDEKIKFREEDYDDFIDDDILVNEEKEIEEQIKLKKLLAEAINLNTHGQLYFSNGMHDLALKSFTEAREMIEAQLSPGHKEVATILINIGLVHLAKRQLGDAEEALTEALNIRINSLGRKHMSIATAYGHLAELYKARAEVREAIDNYAQAIVIMEDLIADFERTLFEVKSKRMNLTGDDEAIATPLTPEEEAVEADIENRYNQVKKELAKMTNNQSLLHFQEKKYKDAEDGFKKAIEIYRSCDEYTEDMKYTYFNLIALYKSHYRRWKELNKNGDLSANPPSIVDAEKRCQELLDLMRDEYGEEVEIAYALELFADIYEVQNKFKQADDMWNQSLKVNKKRFGDKSPPVYKCEAKISAFKLRRQAAESNQK